MSPIPLADVVSVWPLGNLDPPVHVFPVSHIYLNTPVPMTLPVSAPGPVVVQVVQHERITVVSTGNTFEEYSLILGVCEGVKIDIGLLMPVSDRLTDAIARLTPFFHTDATYGDLHKVGDVYLVSEFFLTSPLF